MDTITWKRSIIKRNRNAKIRNWLVVIMLLALAAFGGWRLYYSTTPEYATESLYAALQAGNQADIKKYSDPVKIAENSYSDFLEVLTVNDTNLKEADKNKRMDYLTRISGALLQAATADTVKYISTGSWPMQPGDSLLKGRQLDVDYQYLMQRALLNGIALKGIGRPIKATSGYVIDIYVTDKYTATDFTLHGLLKKSASGWQLVSITNYKEYLEKVLPLHKAQVTEYLNASAKLQNDYAYIYSLQKKQFIKISKTRTGLLNQSQKDSINSLILKQLVPTLKKHVKAMDDIQANGYAAIIKDQRIHSLKLSIEGWQAYAQGIATDDINSINHGRACIKQVDDIEHRLQDLIYFRCTNRNPTVIP